MVARQNQNDQDALDVAPRVEANWMRLVASLRMTALAAPLSNRNCDVNVVALLGGP
jgi:hypothetical protein